jgi:glycosyltransferase involved in cell wall biosynthesis
MSTPFIWRQRRLVAGRSLNLAIIGDLFTMKGERVVKALIESKRFRELPVRLMVFGASPLFPPGYASDDGRVAFHGRYIRDELPQLLEKHEIHAILMTSIWPETFSYTTSEAILLGYPVICFNLGAQAERVKRYNCGIVCDEISAQSLLAAIEQLINDPGQVEKFSSNARSYEPPSPERHFGTIVAEMTDAMRDVSRPH